MVSYSPVMALARIGCPAPWIGSPYSWNKTLALCTGLETETRLLDQISLLLHY